MNAIVSRSMKLVEWVLVAFLGVMATLVFGNVVLRYFFSTGIVFSEEVSRFLFIWITLIGALIVMKDNGHLGMSSVVGLFGERGRRVCRFLADALSLACCVLLVHGSWKQVLLGMDDLAPVTGIPLGIIQSSLLFASAGIAVVLAWSLWRQLTGRMPKEELLPNPGTTAE